MKAKNVLSIFTSKFNMTYKLILFLLLLTLIFVILALACFLPILNGFRSDLRDLNLDDVVGNYIKSVLSGQGDQAYQYDNLISTLDNIEQIVTHWNTNIVVSVVILCLFIYLFGLLYFMSYYSTSDIIHTFMSSNSHFGFASNFIYNLKKSFMFSLMYTPYAFIMYIGGGILSIALGLLVGKWSPFLGLFVTFFVAISILSTRRVLVAYLIPYMVVDGDNTRTALSKNLVSIKKNFWRQFGSYFVVYIIGIILMALTVLCTMGVGVIVAYAVIWYIMQIMDMVDFYTIKGYKYYIDDQTVIDPKKKYKDAVSDEDSFRL